MIANRVLSLKALGIRKELSLPFPSGRGIAWHAVHALQFECKSRNVYLIHSPLLPCIHFTPLILTSQSLEALLVPSPF